MDRRKLQRALDIVTEGAGARVPKKLAAIATEAHRQHSPWSRAPGVQGIGIAKRITDGQERDDLVLKVYVERKRPRSAIDDPVPERITLPGIDAPVETDVEEIGRIRFEVQTMKVRPIRPGVGISRVSGSPGTFGLLVKRLGASTPVYLLTNAHVLAPGGLATVGDHVVQPAWEAESDPNNRVAAVSEWTRVQISADTFPNLCDAAIAELDAADLARRDISLIGVPTGISDVITRGMTVMKTGRETGLTHGVVKDIDFKVGIDTFTPGHGSQRAGFRDQVVCTDFTDPGDSGSAILSKSSRKVVGLHCAGSPSVSIFSRIKHVLRALQIELA